MAQVKVVTDSTSYLPADLIASSGLEVVSLWINYPSGESQLESEIQDLGAYWRELADLTELPTTSQPAPGAFEECFEPLVAAGQDVVAVLISAGISGTVGSAQTAADALKERYPDRKIIICDSRSGGGGLGMIALAAAAAANAGLDADAVAERTRRAVESNKIWFAVDTLEYLRRGGRIGGAQALVGGALKIKPILSIDGTIEPVERVRTSRRAFERMVAYAQELKDAGKTGWLVQHIQAEDEAARLIAAAQEVFGTPPISVSEIGPVIGTHVGPGILGIGGLPPDLLEA